MAESFLTSLKKARMKKHLYPTRKMATSEISDYIERFYNHTRRYSHLRGISLETLEAMSKQA